ncbi:ABC transporter ATP-binding protein, partial [Enterococcus faecalis]
DESTTALDLTIHAQILELLKVLQEKISTSIIFITHDLGVVANVADRVAVMYRARLVEVGTAQEIFYNRQHPYTWGLLGS